MTLNLKDITYDASRDVPRNGLDQPMVVPREGGRPVAYARTTTFIDCIEDKTSLGNWGKRSVLLGAAKEPSLLTEVQALVADLADNPKELRKRLMVLVERALQASGANDKREQGTHLHGLSELVDKGIPLPEGLPDADLIDMATYALVTADMRFIHIERFCVIPQLKVGGTPDRTCLYSGPGPDGQPIEGEFIFDLKTGTVEYGALKMASQLAAYSRGEFYDFAMFPAPPWAPKVTKRDDPEGFEAWKAWDAWCKTEFPAEDAAKAYSPIGNINQDWGIILNLPSGSGQAELYWADLNVGWEACELAKVIRAMRRLSGNALREFVDAA